MPGGTQTTQTSTQAKPYDRSKPLINQALKDAFGLYKDGVGSQGYTGSLVVPMSKYDTKAYGNLTDIAGQNSGAKGLQGNLQNIINNGGFNDYQSHSLDNMQNQLKQLGGNGLSSAQDSAMRNFRDLASSDYSLNANPGAKGVLNNSIRDTTDAVNLNASAAGRYGSGVHEGVLAQKVGDLSSNFRYNDFNNWLGRRDAANQGMASLGQQGIQNRQGLTSSVFNAGQAGQGNMQQAYQGMQAPEQTRLGVGAAYDDLYKRQMDDRLRIFNQQQSAPWDNIGRLLNTANLNGLYKDTGATTTAPGPNPFLQGIGGVATGAGLLGQLGLI